MPERAVPCVRVSSGDRRRDGCELAGQRERVQAIAREGKSVKMTEPTFKVTVERCPTWSDSEIRRRVSAVYARILALELKACQEQEQEQDGQCEIGNVHKV